MGAPDEVLAARVKNAAEKLLLPPNNAKVISGSKKRGFGCFALVNKVLTDANVGAKTALDFEISGKLHPNGDYVWGPLVALEAIQPGYILQFRNHIVRIRTETLGKLTWEVTSEKREYKRLHHSAIVVAVYENGRVDVIEQGVKPDPKKIWRHNIARLAAGEETRYLSNKLRQIITVMGTVKAYRPVLQTKGATLFPDTITPHGGRRMLALYVPKDGGAKRRPGSLGRDEKAWFPSEPSRRA